MTPLSFQLEHDRGSTWKALVCQEMHANREGLHVMITDFISLMVG